MGLNRQPYQIARAVDSHMQREIRRRRTKEKRRLKRQKDRLRKPSPETLRQQPMINNLTTVGLVPYVIDKMSNVMVLQSIVLILVLMLIISFSWNNILNQGVKKVGRIEFTTEEFLGKGCLGTSVFRGTFDGRNVAVKVNI